jgi:serine/threonine protein kinase/tetratricopeptide (TPR) repeat protein
MNADLRGRAAEPSGPDTEGSDASGDDPRVAAALDEYLAELQAGRRPSRGKFLGRYPEIARALDRGLNVLDFLDSAVGSTTPRDAAPPVADDLEPETILGDYRLIREVGRGGMGVVYEARQISLDRRVAVKVLSGAGVLDPRRLQRFRIEAQAVAQLNHPHIVPIFGVGHDRGIHYYAMQYVEGCTLAEILENHPERRRIGAEASTAVPNGRLSDRSSYVVEGDSRLAEPPSDRGWSRSGPPPPASGSGITPIGKREAFQAIARLAIQAAEGLDHAHAMGVLHRDIKPSNLLIDPRGNLWITDFGLARFQDDSGLTLTGDLVGTLRYMAPEMAMGRRMTFDPRSDIYALGATLYELLTLRPVFEGTDRRELLRQITQDEPISPRRIDRAIPRDLETIVLKAMDKEPGRRYTTARELAEDLRRFLEDQPILALPPSPWDHLKRWAHRHRAVLMAAASVALVALGIGSALVWQEQRRTALVLDRGTRAFDDSFRRLIHVSDELTMKGMERFARTTSAPGPDPALHEFYQQALIFYEGLTREPSITPRMKALAFRRLGFTRMVSQMGQDPRTEGDYRRSIELYESLMAGEPRDPELRDGLADAYYNQGVLQFYSGGIRQADPSIRRAIAIVEERAAENPREPQLLELLGGHRIQLSVWLAQSGLTKAAEEERRALLESYARLTRAPSSGPSTEDHARWASLAYHRLAQLMVMPGWERDREVVLRRGLAFAPKHPDLLLELASLLAFRRDAGGSKLTEAVSLAKRAVETQPARSEYWRVLALAHLHAHDLPNASRAVEESLKLHPAEGQASDRLLMAMVSWERGRRDDAKRWYVLALDRMVQQPQEDPDAPKYMSEAKDVLKPILVAEHLTAEPGR